MTLTTFVLACIIRAEWAVIIAGSHVYAAVMESMHFYVKCIQRRRVAPMRHYDVIQTFIGISSLIFAVGFSLSALFVCITIPNAFTVLDTILVWTCGGLLTMMRLLYLSYQVCMDTPEPRLPTATIADVRPSITRAHSSSSNADSDSVHSDVSPESSHIEISSEPWSAMDSTIVIRTSIDMAPTSAESNDI
jgi:hypothetical protein